MRTFKRLILCTALCLTASASYAHANSCPFAVKQEPKQAIEQTNKKDEKKQAKIDALLNKATEAFEKNNAQEGIQCLDEAGNLGCAEALVLLGTIYWRGAGVEKDLKKCFEYNLQAAKLGSVVAQGFVATLYKYGAGTNKDMDKCVEYYKLAIEGGDPESAYQLGCLYYRGQGVKRDPNEATRLFRIASDQGHAGGQYELGMMYSMGSGVEVDQVKAKELIQKSADQGYQMAVLSIKLMEERQLGTTKKK